MVISPTARQVMVLGFEGAKTPSAFLRVILNEVGTPFGRQEQKECILKNNKVQRATLLLPLFPSFSPFVKFLTKNRASL